MSCCRWRSQTFSWVWWKRIWAGTCTRSGWRSRDAASVAARARCWHSGRAGERAVFLYGYAKNERDNIDAQELKALKRLAAELLGWTSAQITEALAQGRLIKVANHG